MTGPRRPPASRVGTATLAGRPAAAGKAASTKATSTKATSTKATSTKAKAGSAGKAKSQSQKNPRPKNPLPKNPSPKRSAPTNLGSTKAAPRGSTPSSDSRSNSRAMARVNGPRGRRDGVGEVERRRKVRQRARILVGLAVTVLLVGVLFVAVLPTSTFFEQRSDTERLEAELTELEAERATIGAEIDRLGTDSEIEAQARRNGFVQPGEEAYNVLPTPIDPIGLPEVWPFTGVEEAMGVR